MSKPMATLPAPGSWLRKMHAAAAFTVPQRELERQAGIRGGHGSEDVLDEHDGELSMYRRVRDFGRDGRRRTWLLDPQECALEVELTRGRRGKIRCPRPLEAWAPVRELDQDEKRCAIAVGDGWEPDVALRPPRSWS